MKEFVVHDAPRIRIDDVRVIDGTGAPARPGQSMLIENGTLARIGLVESLANEKADTVIDGRGRTVIPGLVMMHEHLLFLDVGADLPNYMSEVLSSPKLYLAYGATTIRTAGTFHGSDDPTKGAVVKLFADMRKIFDHGPFYVRFKCPEWVKCKSIDYQGQDNAMQAAHRYSLQHAGSAPARYRSVQLARSGSKGS